MVLLHTSGVVAPMSHRGDTGLVGPSRQPVPILTLHWPPRAARPVSVIQTAPLCTAATAAVRPPHVDPTLFETRISHALLAASGGVVKPCPMVRRDGRLAMPLTNYQMLWMALAT